MPRIRERLPGLLDRLSRASGDLARRLYARSVQNLLLLILLLVLLPVLALQIGTYHASLEEREEDEIENRLELARAVGIAFKGFVHDILDQELAIGLALSSGFIEPPQISALLAANARGSAVLRRYNWLDPQGRVVASSEPQAIGVDLSDRLYVRQIQAGRDEVVSELFVARVGGEPAFAIARGFRNSSGELLGIVVALVDPLHLGQVLPVRRTGGDELVLLDHQGTVVYCFPEKDLSEQQRRAYRTDPTVLRGLAGQETAGIARSPLDGQQRLGAMAPVPGINWVAGNGRLASEVLAPLQQDFWRNMAVVLVTSGGALALALVISRYLTRPIESLRRSVQAVGRGEWAPPPSVGGPVELQELEATFGAMAEELRRRQEQRDDILRAVSHDLRNPLTAVLTQAELLQRLEAPGPAGAGIEAIIANARRMNVMIQDLVDSARIESGQIQLNRRPVDLYPFLLDLRHRLAGTMDIERLQLLPPPWLPPVSADPDRLERIVTNLVSNALKYSPPEAPVTLRLYPQDSEIVTTVSDRGPGIAPEELSRLFQRYYRTEAGRRLSGGLGLGLYITRQLVEAHGGRIWAESRLGEGSTFAFSLPVERNA